MTIDINTRDHPEEPVPTLLVQTLKDLSPREDHKILGGFRSCGSACA